MTLRRHAVAVATIALLTTAVTGTPAGAAHTTADGGEAAPAIDGVVAHTAEVAPDADGDAGIASYYCPDGISPDTPRRYTSPSGVHHVYSSTYNSCTIEINGGVDKSVTSQHWSQFGTTNVAQPGQSAWLLKGCLGYNYYRTQIHVSGKPYRSGSNRINCPL